MGTKILQAALALHERVSSTFRKTAVNFHYEFTVSAAQQLPSTRAWPVPPAPAARADLITTMMPPAPSSPSQIRHLANVFQGLLMSSPDVFNTPGKWAKLWLHESERVYADRLVSTAVSWRASRGSAPSIRPRSPAHPRAWAPDSMAPHLPRLPTIPPLLPARTGP
jgi:dynein heavy chain